MEAAEESAAGVIGGGDGAAARAAARARAPRPRGDLEPRAPIVHARGPALRVRAAAPRPATSRSSVYRPPGVRRWGEPPRPHLRDGLGLLLGRQRAAHSGFRQQLLGGETRFVRSAARALRARVIV